jgi:Uma2 family endonuclease
MSDNTLQFRWIVTLQGGIDALFAENPDVFVAGDLLWYPVVNHPEIRLAPDVLVALGRPKGYRGSYKQWEEGGIAPQVVFEVLSPGNRAGEMLSKYLFYDRYGVKEYYLYDPDKRDLSVSLRQADRLEPLLFDSEFVSPLLGVRFVLPPNQAEMEVYRPDGRRFLTFIELEEQAKKETQRADAEAQRAEVEARRADSEAQRAERLASRLRALGIDPDTL